MATNEPGSNRDRDWVPVFTAMWAAAHIIHLWNQSGGRFTTVTGTLTFLAATFVLLDPRASGRLVVLAALQLLDVSWELPLAPDHWHLVAAVNLAIIVGALAGGSARRGLVAATPAMRVIVIVAYTAAAVAKYNTTFLDPSLSCAVFLADAASFGSLGDVAGLHPLFVGVSVGAESVVAVGLIVPRLRRFGAPFGMAFHFLVSLSPAVAVADFTAALLALFFLFLPSTVAQVTIHRAGSIAARSAVHGWVTSHRPAATTGLVLAGGVSGYAHIIVAEALLWTVVTVYGLAVLASVLPAVPRGGRPMRLSPLRWSAAPALVVIAALATGPYLGFRTTGAFTMFSNLRTEGPGTNHLFLPSVHLSDVQNDLVTLESATADPVRSWAEHGQALPYAGVAQRVNDDGELGITGRHRGRTTTFSSSNTPRPPWHEDKLFNFRPVPAGGDPICEN